MGRLLNNFKAYVTEAANISAGDVALNKRAYGADGEVIGTATPDWPRLIGATKAYNNTGSATATFTVAISSRAQAGDCAVLGVTTRNAEIASTPTGWTQLFHYGIVDAAFEDPPVSNEQYAVYWKILDGTEGATVGVDFENVITSNGVQMHLLVVRNSSGITTWSADANVQVCPSVAVTEGDLVMFQHITSFDASSPVVHGETSLPADMILALSSHNGTTDVGMVTCWEPVVATGNTGTRTFDVGWASYEATLSLVFDKLA